jgi:hypothetical protein
MNEDSIRVFPTAAGEPAKIRCVAGEGAPPPDSLDGPIGFKKFLAALNQNEYDPAAFDLTELNRRLAAVSLEEETNLGKNR